MDPNETLKQLREEFLYQNPDIEEIVSLFQALDQWLSSGGCLPEDWKRPSEREFDQKMDFLRF